MKRKVTEKLIEWKNKTRNRMPLLLYGARQVGKTYALLDFGKKHFENTVYINLETNPVVRSHFDDDISPCRIVPLLEASTGVKISPTTTLIILDEIQSCERALTSLKYFNELAPEYHIIAAGSLLGVAINRENYSFPVGNVDSITMHPLDFEEFLWALDKDILANMIKEAFTTDMPISKGLHEEALELYKKYLIIGGMPGSILEYIEENSFITLSNVQSKILNDYSADMAKYATNAESVKIRAAFNSIPNQLAKENKKFQYKLAQKGGTASIFGVAIEWLCFAGIVLKCQKLEQLFMPIAVYGDLASFKLYMGDVGLLTLQSGISYETILSPLETTNTYIGAITENYVAQALRAGGHKLFYWASNNEAEVDFVLQKGNDIIPVEVKSGVRVRSKSLKLCMDKYKCNYAIRISAKNFGFENDIKSVPLYAVFCI